MSYDKHYYGKGTSRTERLVAEAKWFATYSGSASNAPMSSRATRPRIKPITSTGPRIKPITVPAAAAVASVSGAKRKAAAAAVTVSPVAEPVAAVAVPSAPVPAAAAAAAAAHAEPVAPPALDVSEPAAKKARVEDDDGVPPAPFSPVEAAAAPIQMMVPQPLPQPRAAAASAAASPSGVAAINSPRRPRVKYLLSTANGGVQSITKDVDVLSVQDDETQLVTHSGKSVLDIIRAALFDPKLTTTIIKFVHDGTMWTSTPDSRGRRKVRLNSNCTAPVSEFLEPVGFDEPGDFWLTPHVGQSSVALQVALRERHISMVCVDRVLSPDDECVEMFNKIVAPVNLEMESIARRRAAAISA